MSKSPLHFNPTRFEGALSEKLYIGFASASRKMEREKLIRLLRTKHKDNDEAQTLADKLEACKKNKRCQLAPCPECAPAGQKLLAKVAATFLAKQEGAGHLVCVSIVPADGVCKPKDLDPAYAARNVRRWKERLGRAGVTWFVGALDYSLNEHDTARYKPHWSEHIYGLTTTTDMDRLKKELRKQFPVTEAIPRPVKVKIWDGDPDALAYLLKPNYWRRVATDDGERFTKNGMRSCRATDKQRLRSKERVRLALYLDELGLHGRLVLRWAQFVNRGATASIEERAPKTVGTRIA
ncbi:hypothetical protein HAP48_0004455 [Bradyrhizobium septentrionale]|uniref:Uncharacterized protein n=1 Tax=Bradyrhizobium septentrionale TaxID=1404411 RepID=A0A974A581_9BRAD|nr:hypothetical protein [Bradyrhizobium septentrionale]UGY16794.1 hypothetical protein HAP48_0004455 [Bradyrhizobium septentrionale]